MIPTMQDFQNTLLRMEGYYDPDKIGIKKHLNTWQGNKDYKPIKTYISKEAQEMIRTSPAYITNVSLAKKFGISIYMVKKYKGAKNE